MVNEIKQMVNTLPLSLLLANLNTEQSKDSRRLFHGRGHCFEGLSHINIDIFNTVILITSYQKILEHEQTALSQALQQKYTKQVSAICLQQRELPLAPLTWLWGKPVADMQIEEAGLKYEITLGTRQNCGFFLDMANGRRWLQDSVDNKKVLNLFSYTCAFSVVAIAGGASLVVNLDMSSASLSQGRKNHQINNHNLSKVKFFAHDLFKSWGKLKRFGPYDRIIVDPPSMQKGSFNARNDYGKVVRRMPELLATNGEVLFCLNAPELSFDFFIQIITEFAPDLQFLMKLDPPSTFKESDADKGLKCLIYKKC